ncbi:hypothetical protein DLAC_08930 [Tieghemostelium lacteum]|uniref:Right handed beta helix domain-containing protein n=1 Tax=Tieghemostelium lacteum TaxID=361077 RepID=A0A151Z8R1_TIELA|nr:hypothetical protein DLAC_08930 [Tieghemostelium lacteum]|eukprot:KYQ90326.1 hypothetical protein DLAC_08930 [Tieghemostelium lacteum]
MMTKLSNIIKRLVVSLLLFKYCILLVQCNWSYYNCSLYIRPLEDNVLLSPSTNNNGSDSSFNCGDTLENPCLTISSGYKECQKQYKMYQFNINFTMEEGIYYITDSDIFTLYSRDLIFSGQLSVVFDFSNITRNWVDGYFGVSLRIKGISFRNLSQLFYYGMSRNNRLHISNCVFEDNRNPLIYIEDNLNYPPYNDPYIVIEDSVFQNNVWLDASPNPPHEQSLINLRYNDITITNCTFTNNNGFESMVRAQNGAVLSMNQSRFFNNTIKSHFGLISLGNQSYKKNRFNDCDFIGNGVYNNNTEPKSIFSLNSSILEVANSNFVNNSVSIVTLNDQDCSITISNSSFIGNTQSPLIRSFLNNNIGVYQKSVLTITDSIFENNTISYIGTIFQLDHTTFQFQNSNVTMNDGGIFNMFSSTVYLSDVSIMYNNYDALMNCTDSYITVTTPLQIAPEYNMIRCSECSISYIDTSTLNNFLCPVVHPNTPYASNTNSTGKGTISAIVIAIFVFVSIVIGSIIFYIKRKRLRYIQQNSINTPLLFKQIIPK